MIKEARIASLVSLFPLPQYVVVLEDIEKTRLVPIWIGVNEGNAIALEMQGEKFPRPLTHDLMANIIAELGAVTEKIVVNDLRENSYYALIYIRHNGKTLAIDARPSDSIALAVRVRCPIYVDDSVLKKCPPVSGPITQGEIDKFKEELKSMTPEDFFKNLESEPAPEEPHVPGFEGPKAPDAESEGDEGDSEDEDEENNEEEQP